MNKRAEPPMHLIVGASRGLGKALALSCIAREEAVGIVSRSELGHGLKRCDVHLRYDLAAAGDLEQLKTRLGGLSKRIGRITFCQRHRPERNVTEPELASLTMQVEVIATAEIVNSVAAHKADGAISVVFCSSINADRINTHLSLWYHVSKGATRQLVRYFSSLLEEKGMFFSAVEFGSFRRSGASSAGAKDKLFERLAAKTPGGRVSSEVEAAHQVELIHQAQEAGLRGQIYGADGGLSHLAPEYLLHE